ncbi:MAG: AAA family ATPase [Planctomycetota bacterium]
MTPYEHFGLACPPFEITSDPRVFYSAPSHGETEATLEYATHTGRPCTVVIGDSGSGKTLLARRIATSARAADGLIWIHGLGQSAEITELNILAPCSPAALTDELDVRKVGFADWLHQRQIVPDPTLLIVDDADALPAQAWRDLSALLARDVEFRRPLSMVLFGDPRLLRALAQPAQARLRRRIFRTCTLEPLDRHQLDEYVTCRLRAAGGQDLELFSPEALSEIHHYTHGNPGLINQVCDNALIEAFSREQTRVTAADVLAGARAIVGVTGFLPTPAAPIAMLMDSGTSSIWPLQKTALQRKVVVLGGARKPVPGDSHIWSHPESPCPPSGGDGPNIEERLNYLEQRLGHTLKSVRGTSVTPDVVISAQVADQPVDESSVTVVDCDPELATVEMAEPCADGS